MEFPKTLKILNKSLIIAVIFVILSFVIPLVPCKTSQTASAIYNLSLCKLPNPFVLPSEISQKFWMNFSEPLAGLIIQFLVVFIIFTIIFLAIRRNAAKILDFTHKK
jgi:hypothetical protein